MEPLFKRQIKEFNRRRWIVWTPMALALLNIHLTKRDGPMKG